ncbi:MAG: sigma factor-like helix-turn-helix DNA-binding protein [Chloroflexota bacterium]
MRADLKAFSGRHTEASSWLEDALDRLPSEERTCLLLREQAGLAVAEIAEITGLGLERTRLALFSARERLRSGLPAKSGPGG